MTYIVTIKSTTGVEKTYNCGGATDQEALKLVEANAESADPNASVTIAKDGKAIGPAASVAEMPKRPRDVLEIGR